MTEALSTLTNGWSVGGGQVHAEWMTAALQTLSVGELRERGPFLSELAAVCVVFMLDGSLLRVSRALETLLCLTQVSSARRVSTRPRVKRVALTICPLSLSAQHILRRRLTEDTLAMMEVLAGGASHAPAFFTRLVHFDSNVIGFPYR